MSEIKTESFTRQFRIPLTDEEKMAKREILTNLMDELDEIHVEEKRQKDEMKKNVEAKEGAIGNIRFELKVGELRNIACQRDFRWKTGEVVEFVKDTGEIIGRRAITDSERQLHLDEVAAAGASAVEAGVGGEG